MKTFLLASTNTNKINEIEYIFKSNGFIANIKTLKDFPLQKEPEEDGMTFKENAIIKCKYYYQLFNVPCISEDSGICIKYFNNMPGVYSKRFLENFNNEDKNNFIIKMMENSSDRSASFHDVVCYIDEKGQIHTFEGVVNGEISLKQSGNEGFGYDPIFYISSENKTTAELGSVYKCNNSHRAIAIKKLIEYIKNEK